MPRIPDPSERGDQVLVGFVWTGGQGTATIALSDRADGLVLANRMVLDLGVERAVAAPLATGDAPLVTRVTEALILAVDPALGTIFAGPAGRDPYEIVVYGDSQAAMQVARHARDLLARRVAVWDELDLDADDRIAWDRIAVERGAADGGSTLHLWDLQTSHRYGLVAPQTGGEADRWLAVIADPTGEVDPRRTIRVASLGQSPSGAWVNGLVAGVPHPPRDPTDPASAPAARIRIEPVSAESTVAASPAPNGLTLDVRVDSALTLRAVGAPAPWIELVLPKMDARPGSFEVLSAELADGTTLLGAAAVERVARAEPKPDPKPAPPTPGPDPVDQPAPAPVPGEAVLRLQLPTSLAPGAEVVVRLVHVDTWPLSVFAEVQTGGVSLGR